MLTIFHYCKKRQTFSLLRIIFFRNTSDSNNVREIAAQIIDVKKKNDKYRPDLTTNVARNKAEKIVAGKEEILLKKKRSNSDDDPKEIAEKITTMIPEPPTTCCLSGCANCVWLDYAEKLSKYFENGDEQAISNINKLVTDQNVKAFILHELRMKKKASSK